MQQSTPLITLRGSRASSRSGCTIRVIVPILIIVAVLFVRTFIIRRGMVRRFQGQSGIHMYMATSHIARSFSSIIILFIHFILHVHDIQLCEGNVGGRTLRSRTPSWPALQSYRATVCPSVARRPTHTFSDAFSPTFEKDTAGFAAIWWWWCKTASHGCEAPLLHVRFDEHESHLPKVDVYVGRSIGSDGGEEVMKLHAVTNVFQLLAISCEEYCPSSWPISHSYYISLHICRSIVRGCEWLIEFPLAR